MSSEKRSSKRHYALDHYRVPEGATSSAIHDYLTALDCPRSLAVWLMFKFKEHDQLAEMGFDPLHYENAEDLRDAYAASKFLSKFKDLTLENDLDEVAMEKFKKFELLCAQTNKRFRHLSIDPLYNGPIVWLHNATIRKIESVIGVSPFSREFEWEQFVSLANWGPGASTLVRRRDACAANKFQLETGITRDLFFLLPTGFMQEYYPVWSQHLEASGFPNFQVGNKVVTVPKDATTNRVIAIEPGINLWFQKAIGEMLRLRLRVRGIDLLHQDKNRQFALEGSLTQRLATVDLSSASDSISSSLVRELLPPLWFGLLDACRSHVGTWSHDSEPRKWEKFSSMGNGFTFQLESLIFYAAASACVEYLSPSIKTVSVYGDDVIIPTECFTLFTQLCEFYGFRINLKKSHFNSCFRESCGAHFYRGLDVKPIYLKGSVVLLEAVYRLANAVRRQAHSRGSTNYAWPWPSITSGCDRRLKPVFDHLVSLVPGALRLRIPELLGDGGFISNRDEAILVSAELDRRTKAYVGLEGFWVQHLTRRSLTTERDGVGVLLARLWSLPERRPLLAHLWETSSQEERNTIPLKGRTKLRFVWSLVEQWTDLGPWI